MEPIEAGIVNRPKPQLSDRMIRMDEYLNYITDLACWKADQAERYLAGIKE